MTKQDVINHLKSLGAEEKDGTYTATLSAKIVITDKTFEDLGVKETAKGLNDQIKYVLRPHINKLLDKAIINNGI